MFLQHRNAKTVTAHNLADNNKKNREVALPIQIIVDVDYLITLIFTTLVPTFTK